MTCMQDPTANQAHSEKSNQQIPSWATSLLLHAAVLLLLATITLPLSVPLELSLRSSLSVDKNFDLENDSFTIDLDVNEAALEEAIEETFETAAVVEFESDLLETTLVSTEISLTDISDLGAALSDLGDVVSDLGAGSPGFAGRMSSGRANLLRSGGGTRSSEKAVEAGLDWLARHQYPDGSWNFDHSESECNGRCGNPGSARQARAGATGLALMTFLGAGHTQKSGLHKRTVQRGIAALARMIKVNEKGGSFHEKEGTMYSHGIATMALCEAYAMTGDVSLRAPAQSAIDFICYAQDPEMGGWRYGPRTRGGDTSVMGWQIGALKSGYLSKLYVPKQVISRAEKFLDSVMIDNGARYLYMDKDTPNHESCTAIGALCRMYMGINREDPSIKASIMTITKRGPSTRDTYYNYYCSQVLFHYTSGQGQMWKNWNTKLRSQLVETQVQKGHAQGSWNPAQRGDHGTAKGGRLYTTAMSTMTLEVYYRMLPIYRKEAIAGEFKFQEGR